MLSYNTHAALTTLKVATYFSSTFAPSFSSEWKKFDETECKKVKMLTDLQMLCKNIMKYTSLKTGQFMFALQIERLLFCQDLQEFSSITWPQNYLNCVLRIFNLANSPHTRGPIHYAPT